MFSIVEPGERLFGLSGHAREVDDVPALLHCPTHPLVRAKSSMSGPEQI